MSNLSKLRQAVLALEAARACLSVAPKIFQNGTAQRNSCTLGELIFG